MKRLSSILIGLVAFFSLSAVASATPANGWRVNISDPADQTSKTFKVQYTAFSIGAEDQITIELFQNGSSVGSQTTTKAYGDSGAFDVTVPANGTYSYYIKAKNSTDEAPKTTNTVSVTISDPTVVTVASTTPGSSSGGGSGAGAESTAGTNAAATQPGQVGDSGASTNNNSSDDKKEESLGAKITKNSLTWIIGIPALFALAAALGYYFWQRRADNQ